MSGVLLEEIKNIDVIVSGDGQCDSPGHSAKYLCYYLMNAVNRYILHIELLDKRNVGGSSTNMERQALKKALEHLKNIINIVQVVTDASASILKIISMYTCISNMFTKKNHKFGKICLQWLLAVAYIYVYMLTDQ